MRHTVLALFVIVTACGGGIDSDQAAEAAYVGLDGAVRKALTLGFDGFNAASSANIPPQMTTGDVMGTLTVSGQVDMGASVNKGMRLLLDLSDYQDIVPSDTDLDIVYDTDAAAQPHLDLSLRGIPDAALSGTLTGTFLMTGEIEGDVTLDLSISGMTEADPADATRIRRVVGTTTISGTATSGYGTYSVDITL
jgi:hypothetical protein